MFDYVHPCDHDEFRASLSFSNDVSPGKTQEEEAAEPSLQEERKTFSLRLKCNNGNKNRPPGSSKQSNHKVSVFYLMFSI
jgi:hypothetical protein